MNPWAEPFERNFFFSINCVDMDSIPWEKVQTLEFEEKPHYVLIKSHPDGD